jgi:hypothetical protein
VCLPTVFRVVYFSVSTSNPIKFQIATGFGMRYVTGALGRKGGREIIVGVVGCVGLVVIFHLLYFGRRILLYCIGLCVAVKLSFNCMFCLLISYI